MTIMSRADSPETESPHPNPASASAIRSRRLLAERVARAARAVAEVPLVFGELLGAPLPIPRMLVTTGIGTSEGHARHLAEVAARWSGLPARFVSTASLARGAPPESDRDWLIVFSQGLSANARFALTDVEAWGGVVLVTGLEPGMSPPGAGSDERHAWLASLEERGVVRIDMGCGTESGLLLRVIGARVGYAVAWSLLRTIAERRLGSREILLPDVESLAAAQHAAGIEARRAFPDRDSIGRFFAPDRVLLLAGIGGVHELAQQLSLKIAEGMWRAQPRQVDVLEFTHGPLQGLAGRPASILLLADADRDSEQEPWVKRLKGTLDPACHELRILRAREPWPFAVLEYEAMFDEIVLRSLEETGHDLGDWPGADRETSLYGASPPLEPSSALAAPPPTRAALPYEEATWKEIEEGIAGGRRTALLALGSIEQHGPHLPLGTDRWIAEELARGLAARLEDAVAVPALAVGCASEHLDFPGTLHLSPTTLEAVLRDLIASLARHGFDRVFVFTAHGGNLEALEDMRGRLEGEEGLPRVRIETELPIAAMQADSVAAHALEPSSAGPHAGEFETSLVAWLRPGAVRREALAPGRIVSLEEGASLFYPSLRPNAESGVLGDPSHASADRGRDYLEAWLDLLETAYRAAFPGRTEKKRK